MSSMIMPSHKIFSLLFISFLVSPTTEAQVTYLHHNCSNITFAANSTFQSDRTTILSSLASNNTANTDFYNATVVGACDTVYSLFMCRGDVNLSMCHQCVVNANQRLSSECRVSKEAIIWYDGCLFRSSNRPFFSNVDTRPRVVLLDAGSVSNQASFMRSLYDTMNKTADKAAKPAVGKKKYATGTANFSAFQTVYCLAQCTPDLSPSDCRSCLSDVIGELDWCCPGKPGGSVLYPSCNVRYALYPFYQSEAAIVPPANTTGSQGKGGISWRTIVAIVVPISLAVLIFIVGICCLCKRTRKNYGSATEGKSAIEISNLDSLQYDFSTIKAATNKFSADNRLGEGEFGVVYKGMLPNGQEIAVKRFSIKRIFKTEVEVVARLQHRNVVRLLGFCVHREEMIHVYEYMPNQDLGCFLLNPEKKKQLDWPKRYKIIKGIAQGIQYLHNESRLRIIHRDIKACNVLSDSNLNPKLSEFDLAIIFTSDETKGDVDSIDGTLGYLAPEAFCGEISIKSDVYSFGVILLEIISGKRCFIKQMEEDVDKQLVSYAWKLWDDGEPLELLDPTIRESYTPNEVMMRPHWFVVCSTRSCR